MAEPKQQMEDSSRLMSNHCATTSVVVNFLITYLLRKVGHRLGGLLLT